MCCGARSTITGLRSNSFFTSLYSAKVSPLNLSYCRKSCPSSRPSTPYTIVRSCVPETCQAARIPWGVYTRPGRASTTNTASSCTSTGIPFFWYRLILRRIFLWNFFMSASGARLTCRLTATLSEHPRHSRSMPPYPEQYRTPSSSLYDQGGRPTSYGGLGDRPAYLVPGHLGWPATSGAVLQSVKTILLVAGPPFGTPRLAHAQLLGRLGYVPTLLDVADQLRRSRTSASLVFRMRFLIAVFILGSVRIYDQDTFRPP